MKHQTIISIKEPSCYKNEITETKIILETFIEYLKKILCCRGIDLNGEGLSLICRGKLYDDSECYSQPFISISIEINYFSLCNWQHSFPKLFCIWGNMFYEHNPDWGNPIKKSQRIISKKVIKEIEKRWKKKEAEVLVEE